MISEICVLSPVYEPLLKKTYRYDVKKVMKDTTKTFVAKFQKAEAGSICPHFKDENVYYYFIQRHGIIFFATSVTDTCPITVIELLGRLYHIFKDFCGTVSENAIKRNLLLLNEVLDEVLDYGYVQLSSTQKIKPYVSSQPVVVESPRAAQEDVASRLLGFDSRVAPFNAANKPVIRSQTDMENRKNEIFVDVVERLTAVVNSDGTISRLEVNGSINMKNFLIGSPQIKIALNEDMVITKDGLMKGFGKNVQLDRCSFHQCVKLDDFEASRVLKVHPQTGEISIMTYGASGEMSLTLPIKVMTFISDIKDSRDIDVTVRLKCDIPANCHAVYITVRLKIPKSVTSMSQNLSGSKQTAEFNKDDCVIVWKIKNLPGGTEAIGRFRLISQSGEKINRREIGPVFVEFEMSGYTSTGFQIRYMRVFDQDHSYVPFRWIRYITVTDSYTVKL